MSEYTKQIGAARKGVPEEATQELTMPQYLKKLATPFNIVAGIIVLVGLGLIVVRYTMGLGAVTSASQDQPWGLFLNIGLFSGVPLSASGFVLGTVVFIFGLKHYEPVVKNAVLLGFLGYLFAVIFLLIDLGRPWRLPYPMAVSFGTTSVLFLVAWHVALYLSCQFLEFVPSLFEWAGWKVLRRWTIKLTIGLTIFGIMLSTLHQSALGALFLLAPGKLHPLWYTPYLPVLFLNSAIAGGLCLVIFVTYLTRRFLKEQADAEYLASIDKITLGLGKGVSLVLITYFAVKIIALAHGNHWSLLNTTYGYWYLVEILGFVLLPGILFALGSRSKNVGL
ncbi:MAG: NrfD/PsrC family molybdoenzyme membrane anchor subunit, partial [Dehalococcoidia bacterium]|nr:NrfD/PsrC family molybdoenzyme membrane anchor subunit [Dehalococcoidia bacterium]